MKRPLLLVLTLVSAFLCSNELSAVKKGYKLNVEKQSKDEIEQQTMSKGSFMVASKCHDCNNGYEISMIRFSGYDKPRKSSKETFFITNNTDRTMNGVNLYIDYRTTDGRQLNKRFIKLLCNIPPGETRAAEIESWDKQKEFYYTKSDPGKSGGMPFTVVFDPVAFYLRF